MRSEVAIEVAFLSMERTKDQLQRGRGRACVEELQAAGTAHLVGGSVLVLLEAAHGPG